MRHAYLQGYIVSVFFWRSTKIWLSMHPRHFGSHVTVVRPPARQGNQIECKMAFF